MSDEKPLPSHEAAGAASVSLGLPPTEPQGEHEEEAAVGRTPLERAADAAEELYRLRDTFFPGDPAEKTAALRACADSVLALLDALPPGERKSPKQRGVYEFLRGKILDVFPDYEKEAEDHLSKAGSDKKILSQFSMLERSMVQGSEDQEMLLTESIKHAKEAVMLDITDGNSWYNLGNAYITSFFVGGAWDHSQLHHSLKAYQNAEKDKSMNSNPDLYYNFATADKYLENYERALRGFEAAALKDLGLGADTEVQKIVSLLDKLETAMKGQLHSKRLASLVSSLSNVELKTSHKKATIRILSEGLNKTVAVLGKVVLLIRHDNVAPLYYLTSDLDQSYFILSVYGLRNDAIKEGDRVVLFEPYYRILDTSWKDKSYQFKSIRVDFPEQILINEKDPAPHYIVWASIHAHNKP